MKYGIGQKVRIKDFTELREKFGVDNNGNIIIGDYMFDRQQKIYCGETYTIRDRFENLYELDTNDDETWYFSEEVLELSNELYIDFNEKYDILFSKYKDLESKYNLLLAENIILKNKQLNYNKTIETENEPTTSEIVDDIIEDIKPKKRAYNRKPKV